MLGSCSVGVQMLSKPIQLFSILPFSHSISFRYSDAVRCSPPGDADLLPEATNVEIHLCQSWQLPRNQHWILLQLLVNDVS